MFTNKNLSIVIIFIVLVAGGVWWYIESVKKDIDNLSKDAVPHAETTAAGEHKQTPASANRETGSVQADLKVAPQSLKEFLVVATPFKFSVAEMRVKKGDTVRLNFRNMAGSHDWNLDEFNAAAPVLEAGQDDIVEFVADKKGTFEYYCSVDGHRQKGMKGKLIVE